MAYEDRALDATLAAAAGDDPALLAELRAALGESFAKQADLLRRARCDGNWIVAAQRLRSVAASFHAERMMKLASEAVEAVPGDPVILREIDGEVRALTG